MTRPPAGAASPILAVGLFRHFELLMGKLFELTFDLGIARLLCALFALRSHCAIVFGTW
jgi:hypothetical protein